MIGDGSPDDAVKTHLQFKRVQMMSKTITVLLV